MKQVAPLSYDVIFKKAFSVPEIFTAFVRDFVGIELEIDSVEKDKVYDPPIGNVAIKFDLYAEDNKNRVIVDVQHVRFPDHYHRFLHYHCAALLQQLVNSTDYHPGLKVFTLVILTSGDKHKKDISIIDFDPKDLEGNSLGEIDHKIIYICPKYLNKKITPKQYHEWMEAIEDSLDEQVDETHYNNPEIKHIFDIIEKDKVSPQDRAKMFDEVKQEKLQESMEKGRQEGLKEAKEESARNLLSIDVLTEEQIAQVTGLTVERIKELIA
jgi:predicted transposase/invertase (TIGR01784 family)